MCRSELQPLAAAIPLDATRCVVLPFAVSNVITRLPVSSSKTKRMRDQSTPRAKGRHRNDFDSLPFYRSLSTRKWSGDRHAGDIRRRIDNVSMPSSFPFSLGTNLVVRFPIIEISILANDVLMTRRKAVERRSQFLRNPPIRRRLSGITCHATSNHDVNTRTVQESKSNGPLRMRIRWQTASPYRLFR